MSGQSKYQSFQEFWPFYLREHAHPLSRAMHYIGTTGVMAIVVAAFASGNLVWLWLMPLCGYGFAWAAHFFVEKNKPATFTYPLWSLIGDFRMYFLFLSGGLSPHLQAAGVNSAD